MKNNNSNRKNIVLAEAIASGKVAEADKTMTAEDNQRSVSQASLEFLTTILNQGVAEEGTEFLTENPRAVKIVGTLQKLAKIRGLTTTVEMLKDRFENEGLIDTDKEIEGNTDTDQINQPLSTPDEFELIFK